MSFWESREAIEAFAGQDIGTAVFFPDDEQFLIERDLAADHYEVAGTEQAAGTLPLAALPGFTGRRSAMGNGCSSLGVRVSGEPPAVPAGAAGGWRSRWSRQSPGPQLSGTAGRRAGARPVRGGRGVGGRCGERGRWCCPRELTGEEPPPWEIPAGYLMGRCRPWAVMIPVQAECRLHAGDHHLRHPRYLGGRFRPETAPN